MVLQVLAPLIRARDACAGSEMKRGASPPDTLPQLFPLMPRKAGKPPLPSHTPISVPPSCPGSDPPTQLSRLMKRNGLSQVEAEARIASQLPLDEKRKLASHIIDNSGDRESTRQQVLRLHARLEDSLDFLWARLAVATVVAGLGGLVYLLLRHFIS